MKENWRQWEEFASRITGFSVPIFGLSWNPPTPDRTAAERAITYLESRGLLYADFQWEKPDQCYTDAAAVREELTEQMKSLARDAPVFRQLDAIRNACRSFRDKLRQQGVERVNDHAALQDRQKAEYFQALGALRDASGNQIMLLCVQYGIDVAAHLAGTLPALNTVSDE